MTICYFTGTGNCLYVARTIGGTLLSIPQLMRQDAITIEDDAVGIVAPVYGAEMPMMVRDFFRKASIRTDYFFFIYTFGMGYAQAFSHVAVAAGEAGIDLSYINAVQMVDNYLPYFDMEEQIESLQWKDVDGQLAPIRQDILSHTRRPFRPTEEDLAEMRHWTENHAVNILKKDTAQGYAVLETCIRCGICAKVCPANNITVTEQGVGFSDHCEVCYACLQNCPQNAIHMPVEAGTAHFRNEHVSLQDIMDANG